MTYLLDTHYVLWSIAETKKLSAHVRDIITDPNHRIIVSTISFWEVSLKTSIGKLEISGMSPADLPQTCLDMGFEVEALSAKESSTYHQLKATYHKDPFDRMLIWQAICNGHTLITADSNVKKYTSEGLKVLVEGK